MCLVVSSKKPDINKTYTFYKVYLGDYPDVVSRYVRAPLDEVLRAPPHDLRRETKFSDDGLGLITRIYEGVHHAYTTLDAAYADRRPYLAINPIFNVVIVSLEVKGSEIEAFGNKGDVCFYKAERILEHIFQTRN